MCLCIVWIEIYAQTAVMAAILDLCKLKIIPKVLSGNQAKFVLQIHVTTKPSKNNTLLMTARYSIRHLDYIIKTSHIKTDL